jgi:hypothetical protein
MKKKAIKTTRKKKCSCTCKHKKKVKRKTVKRTTRKRTTTKRKPAKRIPVKIKTSIRKTTTGNTFRLSPLQKKKLSVGMQKAILERQRKLGKRIIT